MFRSVHTHLRSHVIKYLESLKNENHPRNSIIELVGTDVQIHHSYSHNKGVHNCGCNSKRPYLVEI